MSNTKPIQWSFSSLKDFIGCPKRYYEVKVAKNFETKITQAITYGKEVHSALEYYVRDGKALPKNYERFKETLDALVAIPGQRYCEHEMGLMADGTPCKFSDKNRWVRGIADLLIVDGQTAYVVDYKTGNDKYPDLDQLKLMALMVFAHFPEVNLVKGALLFILKDNLISQDYERKDIDAIWETFTPKVKRLELSYQTNEWPANPTPLCGYCPVSTCEFCKER
jgi:CRISPR/Cas system-associated exonuclease Cas4 (RecB family)